MGRVTETIHPDFDISKGASPMALRKSDIVDSVKNQIGFTRKKYVVAEETCVGNRGIGRMNHFMTKVSIISTGSSPEMSSICDHLSRSIELLGGLDCIVANHSKVLLKPNTGAAVHPEEQRNTDPRIIEAMIILLREIDVDEIIIGESSIVGTDTMEAFNAMGIDKIAELYKVRLVDLKKMPFKRKKVPLPFVLPSIQVSTLVPRLISFTS